MNIEDAEVPFEHNWRGRNGLKDVCGIGDCASDQTSIHVQLGVTVLRSEEEE